MPATLTVLACSVTTNSITITFSQPVDPVTALTLSNYTVYDPPAFAAPTGLNTTPPVWVASPLSADGLTVTFTATPAPFNDGDYVLIAISNIALAGGAGSALVVNPTTVSAQVPGTDPTSRTTRDVEDAIAYPILTEEIGYRPSPVGIPVAGGGGSRGGGASNLGQVALSTIADVLGWKTNNTDPKGFIGALTQSFTLKDVEGHIESSWVPRTYAVQTDLGGGITGAQASLYMRAKDALDQSLPLLDGLYPLDPEADPEYVKALREMARSQMTEIVKEFGVVGLPSILRINTYFGILLGQNPGQINANEVQLDPDLIKGTLGSLRDTYGIYFQGNPFNNSVEDEQDITNFRVISDYMTSIMQSWIANRQFFIVTPGQDAFFGTQLVLISRQFSVIAETVNEARFTLDSVFIGPAERQALLLRFADGTPPNFQDRTPPTYLEDIFNEAERFSLEEGPRLLRDGGKISVSNNILPVAQTLANLIAAAHNPANIDQLPDGYRTARVQKSLDDLEDQIVALIDLIEQVEQEVPPPEKFTITGVEASRTAYNNLSVFGNGFDPAVEVTVNSSTPTVMPALAVTYYSAQRVDVDLSTLTPGTQTHDITLTNPDGETATLYDAFIFSGGGVITATVNRALLLTKSAKAQNAKNRAAYRSRRRNRRRGSAPPAAQAPVKPSAAPTPPAKPTPAPPAPTGPTPSAALSKLQAQVSELKTESTNQSKALATLSEELKTFRGISEKNQNDLTTNLATKFDDLQKLIANLQKP
jgi:hypothetical protein